MERWRGGACSYDSRRVVEVSTVCPRCIGASRLPIKSVREITDRLQLD